MSRLTISLSPTLRAAVVALAALVAATAPAALRAQTATTLKVFYACYVPSSGSVYRIREVDLKQECSKPTHVQFSWTDGNPAALSRTFNVTSSRQVAQAQSQKDVVVPCPAGSQLVGGGHAMTSGTIPLFAVWRNSPDAAGTGWAVSLINLTDASQTFTVYARCAQ